MVKTGTITLIQENSKKTGNPYTALNLKIGKWSGIHFPSSFERDYLIDHFGDGKSGKITLTEKDNEIRLLAGDFVATKQIDSILEYKYIAQFLRSDDEKTPVDTENDGKIDLHNEDERGTGFLD